MADSRKEVRMVCAYPKSLLLCLNEESLQNLQAFLFVHIKKVQREEG
jgi:hypothetical protein